MFTRKTHALGELASASSDVLFLHAAIDKLLAQQVRPPRRQSNDHAPRRESVQPVDSLFDQ